jgi:hypothetical protein
MLLLLFLFHGIIFLLSLSFFFALLVTFRAYATAGSPHCSRRNDFLKLRNNLERTTTYPLLHRRCYSRLQKSERNVSGWKKSFRRSLTQAKGRFFFSQLKRSIRQVEAKREIGAKGFYQTCQLGNPIIAKLSRFFFSNRDAAVR